MENELTILNRKVQTMLSERNMPEEIKSMVESIFQEYRSLYESNMKENGITTSEQYVAFKNIDEYFEGNTIQSMHKINNAYKEKCIDKAETAIMILSTFEPERYSDVKDSVLEKSEIDALNKSIINDRENYLYVERITNTVIDCIEDSKNQWFRILEGLRTNNQKKEYIYGQIKLIENSAKMKIGNLKEYLQIDDRQILDQILGEYETYKENKQKNGELKQDAHQKFVNEYKVSQEELQKNAQIQENINEQNEQVKENIELPGNVLE